MRTKASSGVKMENMVKMYEAVLNTLLPSLHPKVKSGSESPTQTRVSQAQTTLQPARTAVQTSLQSRQEGEKRDENRSLQ
jgi:hypothetical protein